MPPSGGILGLLGFLKKAARVEKRTLQPRGCVSIPVASLPRCVVRSCAAWLGLSPMLRLCSCVIARAVILLGLPTAHAADTTLTLACQGTTTAGTEDKPEPISMGIIVNFMNRTVQGYGAPGVLDYPIKITAWNDVTVAFLGSHERIGSTTRGSIDRVTGDVEATSIVFDVKTGSIKIQTSYSLKCRPTPRMF
jgi:hypothetical protein